LYPVKKPVFKKAENAERGHFLGDDDYDFYWKHHGKDSWTGSQTRGSLNGSNDIDAEERFEDIYGDVRPLAFEEKYAGDDAELCDLCNSPAEYITEEGTLLCNDCLMYLQGDEFYETREPQESPSEAIKEKPTQLFLVR
jgi:hypothetical protein